MTITARYQTRCPSCGLMIQVGDDIEWERGQKAAHVSCPTLLSDGLELDETQPQVDQAPGRPATDRQVRYALTLLSRMDEPLIGDAFAPPTAEEVMSMSRSEISWLIDELRADAHGEY